MQPSTKGRWLIRLPLAHHGLLKEKMKTIKKIEKEINEICLDKNFVDKESDDDFQKVLELRAELKGKKEVLELIDERINILEHGTEFKPSKINIKTQQIKELEFLKKRIIEGE